jgi:hypothetical protein
MHGIEPSSTVARPKLRRLGLRLKYENRPRRPPEPHPVDVLLLACSIQGMAKIGKLEAAKRQLDSAIRMFFKNEDMLAVHTVSRAAFRVLYDLTKGDAVIKKALETHINKVGPHRFNEETNFLKHANQDPAGEIDENFHTFTEAGIGMSIGLFKHHDKNLTAEMPSFLTWSAVMRPGFFDLSEGVNQVLDEWRKNSQTDPAKITDADKKIYYGDAILQWTKLNWKSLAAIQTTKNEAKAAPMA